MGKLSYALTVCSRPLGTVVIAGAVALAALGGAAGGPLQPLSFSSSAAAPAQPPAAPADPAPSPTPTMTSAPSPTAAAAPERPALPAASAPTRITYPSAGADVVIHTLTPTAADLANHAVEPPETKDAYWLSNYGAPGEGSTDTTYIAAHRWVGADSPFNHIGERAKQGDLFTVTTGTGAITYRVSSVVAYSKDTLNTAPIWDIAPGRVVIITCNSADPWGKNTVITAEPVRP